MIGKIEHSSKTFRGLDFSTSEIRGTSRFASAEVMAIVRPRDGLGELRDLRQIGCPDEIFEQVLDARAKKLGITPKADGDLDRRLAEASIF